MTNTAQTPTKPSHNWALRQAGTVVDFVDQRVTASSWLKRNARKAFPNHWSFWLGHIAVISLGVILLSGVFLTLWFKPSMAPVAYDGAYAPCEVWPSPRRMRPRWISPSRFVVAC